MNKVFDDVEYITRIRKKIQMTICEWRLVINIEGSKKNTEMHYYMNPWISEEEAKRQVEAKYPLWKVISARPKKHFYSRGI